MSAGFEEIDFSGDIGLLARGNTREELLAVLARGLFALMASNPPRGPVARRLSVRSVSESDLVVDWLSEIILSAATHGELYGAVTIERAGETEVDATLHGGLVDPGRHAQRFDVKAATYHGLELRETEAGFEARVIFDL